MKQCSQCGQEKIDEEFYEGFVCKECLKPYQTKYYQNNKEKIKIYNSIYRKEHKEYFNQKSKEWHRNNPKPLIIKEKFCSNCNTPLTSENSLIKGRVCFVCKKLTKKQNKKRYKQKKREKSKIINAQKKLEKLAQKEQQIIEKKLLKEKIKKETKLKKREQERIKWKQNYDKNKNIINEKRRIKRKLKFDSDPYTKMIQNLRKRKSKCLKNCISKLHTKQLLNIKQQDFMDYISSLFLPGMTFENYGKNGWHLDHIIPINYFNLTNEEDVKICFHHLNLQPLWEKDNLYKHNFLPPNYLQILQTIKNNLGIV